jgi:hypothetical protein
VGEKIGRLPESGWNQISPTISPTQSVRFAGTACYLMRSTSIAKSTTYRAIGGGKRCHETSLDVLHEKLDLLREKQWSDLLQIQREQLGLLTAMSQKPPAAR